MSPSYCDEEDEEVQRPQYMRDSAFLTGRHPRKQTDPAAIKPWISTSSVDHRFKCLRNEESSWPRPEDGHTSRTASPSSSSYNTQAGRVQQSRCESLQELTTSVSSESRNTRFGAGFGRFDEEKEAHCEELRDGEGSLHENLESNRTDSLQVGPRPEDDDVSSQTINVSEAKIKDLIFDGIHSVPADAENTDECQVAFLKCSLHRTKNIWGTQLKLSLSETGQALLIAQCRQRSRNYHIYDVSRGTLGRKLTKKGGNYVGKIAAFSTNEPRHYLLVDNKSTAKQRNELGLFIYHRTRALTALIDGAKPRQICVALPGDSEQKSLLSRYLFSDSKLTVLNQQPPKLVNGQYSLNFNGRATIASVKNCQLVEDGGKKVALQLGKVDSDRFNLDFTAPFSPLLAFALAVSQFMS